MLVKAISSIFEYKYLDKPKQSLYVVIGTRAQLIKMAPVLRLLEKYNIAYQFIYTAQHKETISKLIASFGIKKPDVLLFEKTEANTRLKFVGWASSMFLKLFTPKKIFPQKGIVLVHGDTASALWGAICGRLAGCTVAHIESGLRSYNLFNPFPEELIRLMVFRFTDIFFCPDKWAVRNVAHYKGEKVNTHGNTLLDALKIAIEKPQSQPAGRYIIISIHRFENIFTKRLTNIIIPYIKQLAKQFKVYFVLHPTTQNVLKKKNLLTVLQKLGVNLTPRLDYFAFVNLLAGAQFVVTDGGSNQEELYYLGKPTLLMRSATERQEGLEENVIISDYNWQKLNKFAENYKMYERKVKLPEISPSQIILEFLKNKIEKA